MGHIPTKSQVQISFSRILEAYLILFILRNIKGSLQSSIHRVPLAPVQLGIMMSYTILDKHTSKLKQIYQHALIQHLHHPVSTTATSLHFSTCLQRSDFLFGSKYNSVYFLVLEVYLISFNHKNVEGQATINMILLAPLHLAFMISYSMFKLKIILFDVSLKHFS